MNTQEQLITRFGNPMASDAIRLEFERNNMTLWDIPADINAAIQPLPNKIYVNKLLVAPLERVFRKLIDRKLENEIKTWDGCFNVRFQRGSRTRLSRHSWGLAIDMNAAWNPLIKVTPSTRAALRKKHVQWSEAFLDVWREEGFSCGADWKNSLDGMHFELPV